MLPFDVVIFDEASQIRPSDAINAIYRGSQLIVAGDERQLPPTSFFDRLTQDGGTDEYQEDQFDDFESILTHAKIGSIEQLGLRWHYRSRHESLISYSNYSFYDGELITYPGALDVSPDLGVEYIGVPDGIYQRGAGRDNPIEARKVVERVLYHAQNHQESTLGVVAFSEAQASRIMYELEAARRNRPDLDDYFTEDRLDGFFVKNLENVQGDERDIIIFSIGYGRDEVGKFTLNFGPINLAGGWRRLNVAVTRARKRVEVVASITAGDIGDSPNPGVRHLKRYLDYAARGLPALAVPVSEEAGDAESPFEEEVLRVVRSWSYDVQPQVGQAGYRIDMAVRHPEKPGTYVLGIECDGAMYHSSLVARDRDRLRQDVLEGLGWELHRIWGPAWYRNRAGEEARLRAAIEDAIAGRRPEPRRVPRKEASEPDVDLVDFDAAPAWTRPYRITRLSVTPGLAITDPAALLGIERAINAVVRTEGPISWELCAHRVRAAFGQARLGSRIREVIYGRIRQMARRGEIEELEPGFLSVPGRVLDEIRVPDPDVPESRRTAAEVSWSELKAGMIRIVSDAHTIDDESLGVAVSRLFRWSRTADVRAAIDQALDDLITSGVLTRNGSGITTGLDS
jgi:hypothetical protein